ncbi:MAG: DegT/DnrJ/EryC1/StrS family aminotransferase [Nitrososphaeria archaeon]
MEDRLAVDGGKPVSRKPVPISRPSMGEEEASAVREVVLSGNLREGRRARELESRMASYIGVKHAMAVNSGTSSLLATYMAALERGSEVIVPAFTFVATASAAAIAGMRPVFADIRLDTYELDLEDAANRLSGRTGAIVLVNLYGLSGDVKAFEEFATDHGLKLIIDSAQALGALVDGREAGSYGDASCYSFYPSKNITTGEGGLVATDDDSLAERVKLVKDHGQRGPYLHEVLGLNLRLGEMEAAIGLVQLSKLESMIGIRRRNAERLTRGLAGIPGIHLPVEPQGRRHTYNLFTVRMEPELYRVDRDRIVEAIRAEGVDARVYYPMPLHRQPIFNSQVDLPNSELAAKTVFSLPTHPALSDEDVENVIGATVKVLTAYLRR